MKCSLGLTSHSPSSRDLAVLDTSMRAAGRSSVSLMKPRFAGASSLSVHTGWVALSRVSSREQSGAP